MLLKISFFSLRPNKPRTSSSKTTQSNTKSNLTLKKEEIDLYAVKKEKDLELLKQFDLNIKFGPCYNVKRLDRWLWAKSHNLNPPEDIKLLIETNQNSTEYTESIWYCYRSIL